MKFRIEYDDYGNHRLVHVDPITNWDLVGDWAGHQAIATVRVGGTHYHHATDHHEGHLPVDEVFKVVARFDYPVEVDVRRLSGQGVRP